MELSSTHVSTRAQGTPRPATGQQRGEQPWLAVYWKCCRTYSRMYRNQAGDAYRGQCPRCGRKVRATIGANGVQSRFFTAE